VADQDKYTKFGTSEWDGVLKALIGDIIRNRRRKASQADRRDNPDLVAPKPGRPRKVRPITQERELSSSPIYDEYLFQ